MNTLIDFLKEVILAMFLMNITWLFIPKGIKCIIKAIYSLFYKALMSAIKSVDNTVKPSKSNVIDINKKRKVK